MSHAMSFQVTGLSCAACVGRAQSAMRAVAGVERADLNLANARADVVLGAPDAMPDVAAALERAGYPAARHTTQMDLSGLSCAACVARAEAALGKVPGVLAASVNLATRQAQIEGLEGAVSSAALAQALRGVGLDGTVRDDAAPAPDARAHDEAQQLVRQFWFAAILALPVFILEMGGHLFPPFHHLIMSTLGHTTSWAIQGALTTALLAGPGRMFFARGVPALLRGAPDMNALVALGTGAAWLFSMIALLWPGLLPAGTRAVYFEAAAVITTLILLGRVLEARARGRTGAAIARLVGLQPKTARRARDGQFEDIPLAQVAVGDVLILRAGERVPTDAVILKGESYVDESMITGEPVPVVATPGRALVGGTVNGTGVLELRTTAVGEATTLAQIIRMVQQAQGAKLPIQSLVDRITTVFVPAVMAAATLAIAAWLVFGPAPALGLALVAGVSVLIIACPCAMGLATPTSIMVGTGRAADLGVLFRKGDALQTLADARTIAFDKTGTLTLGRPELTTARPINGWSRDGVLRLTAAVEKHSEHPIARAIVAAAKGPLPQADEVRIAPGMGLSARVETHQIHVGTARYMASLGDVSAALTNEADALAARGETPVLVAVDGAVVAVLGVCDPIKPTTPEAVRTLQDMGLSLALITGDTTATARHIADHLGIAQVVAEVLPGGKVDAIAALQGPVAFVGDGINDAPALARADTGIAIGTGTDVAIEAADVVLMSGDLNGVVTALRVSRATLRNIRQNLFWAFAYNTALIPVAAGALYPLTGTLLSPMLAAGAMALSSVFVISNALRLRRLPATATATAKPQHEMALS